MGSLNAEIQKKSGSKNKNVKYGCSDKENVKPSLQTCNNKSKKKLNKVAFLSGLSRFDVKKNNTLGPGIYNITFPKCQTKNNGKFSGRSYDFNINMNLPPNMYADGLKHHTIETRVKKKLTARGPYDTFTGPRDSSTLVGHTAEKKCFLISDNWPLSLKSDVSKNRTYTNIFKQYSPRRKIEHYVPEFRINISNWLSKKTNKYPFNSSQRIGDSLKTIENSLNPGPGHYDVNSFKRRAENGHTNVFKSTTAQRLQIIRKSYGIFD